MPARNVGNVSAYLRGTQEMVFGADDRAFTLFKGSIRTRGPYATAAKGATDYNLKIIEFARPNTAFEYAQEG
jgi:hypothetical protein